MKKVVSVIIVSCLIQLFSGRLLAQYEPFIVNEDLHYLEGSSVDSNVYGNVFSLRIDEVLYGADGIEYIPKTGSMQPSHQHNWIGSSIVVTQTGEHLFIGNSDTLKIRTNAGINDTWTAINNGDSKVMITYQGITIDTVLETLDSVKHFQYYLIWSNGDTLLTDEILLSKNHGYLSLVVPNLLGLEYPVWRFKLIGTSENNKGYQNLEWGDVYNFQVGDIFHIWSGATVYSNYSYTHWNKRIIREVFEKIDTDSSYQYTIKRTTREESEVADSVYLVGIVEDTIVLTFSKFHQNFNDLSHIQEGEDLVLSGNGEFGRIKTFPFHLDLFPAPSYPYFWDNHDEYINASGGPFYFRDYYDGNTSSRRLIYKKSGTQEIGTPFDPTLFNQMVSIISIDSGKEIQLYPNPVSDRIEIKFDNSVNIETCEIYGLDGRLTDRFIGLPANDELVFKAELPNGTYIFKLTTTDGEIYSKLFVKL